jgi:hypothetical protein
MKVISLMVRMYVGGVDWAVSYEVEKEIVWRVSSRLPGRMLKESFREIR